MAKTIVQNRVASNQANFTKEGEMEPFNFFDHLYSFYAFIDGIIIDYGKWTTDNYSLNANSLDPSIQRLFLPYVLESDELEDLEENPSLSNTYFKEHIDFIQKCIDERCFPVFTEAMEEMGYHLCQHRDNGEQYFSRY